MKAIRWDIIINCFISQIPHSGLFHSKSYSPNIVDKFVGQFTFSPFIRS